ncbi:J domain-containing protein [Natrialbaceae archaeon A-arb3/5]
MGESYYDVLGVGPDASRAEIRDAYRDRVLETHPDHNDDPDATEQFQRVSTAESVLTDGTERARYDRLGHDAYVRLADQTTGTTGETDSSSMRSTSTETHTETNGSTNRANESSAGRRANERSKGRHSSTRSERAYARQQYWQQSASERTTTENWSSETERTGGETARTGADDESESGFRYAVQDWDDEIELEEDHRSLDHSTTVTLGCIWLLYPLFLYATLTPWFSPVVNVILGVCTLGLVGYLLMIPRVATMILGFWSLFLPAGIAQFSIVDPFSLRGLLAIAFVWIPFGYAVVLWWALRP